MYREKRIWSNAKRAVHNGVHFDSKLEVSYAQELDLLIRAGEIKSWERPTTGIPLIVNGYEICKYKIDFIVYHNDGLIEYVECKGRPFPIGILKFKIFEAMYSDKPNVKITMIKQKNNWSMRKLKKVGK